MGTEEEISEEFVGSQPPVDRRKLFRRLLALAGLGITGVLLSQEKVSVLPPVQAANGDAITVGGTFSGTSTTELDSNVTTSGGTLTVKNTSASGNALVVSAGSGTGVNSSSSTGNGVNGSSGNSTTTNAAGVKGINLSSTGFPVGVWGEAGPSPGSEFSPLGAGVVGNCNSGIGVLGQSNGGTGIIAQALGSNAKALIVQGASGQVVNLQEWQVGGTTAGTGTALSVVDKNGNFGISNGLISLGGPFPATLLHVQDTVNNATGSLALQTSYLAPPQFQAITFLDGSGYVVGGIKHTYVGSGQTQLDFYAQKGSLHDFGNITDVMTLQGTGNVGIGVSTPTSPLHVVGPGFEEIKFQKSGGTQLSRLHATGDGINRFAVNQSYDGTNFNLDNTADNGVSFLINSNPSASGIFAIQYIPAGSNPATSRVKSYMFMKSNGYVGIGTTTPAFLLDVAGAVHATSFPTSSDIRFKENIQPIDNALDKVLRLNGVYFNWNQLHRDQLKRDNTRARQVGLVAQQVKEVIPEIVSEWADDGAEDYLAVDYSRLVAIMIEAMKEQQELFKTENGKLQERIATLERKLAAS